MVCLVLVAVLLLLAVVALGVGSAGLFAAADHTGSFFYDESGPVRVVVYNLRLPRLIMAVEVGACLAVAGALLQAVMRNPLADPGIIGVSAGAATAATTILLLFPTLVSSVPLFCFWRCGFGLCTYLFAGLARWIDTVRIILSGVAINTVLGAYNSFLQLLNSDNLSSVLSFMNGSLSGRSWDHVYIITVYAFIGLVLGVCCIKKCQHFAAGDEMAQSLGVNVTFVRIFLSAVAAFLAAATVSRGRYDRFCRAGLYRHIARMMVGSDYKALLPVSMLLGAVILLAADTLGRTLIPGMEIPVGIVMAVTGGPFFLYMLRKKGKVSGS